MVIILTISLILGLLIAIAEENDNKIEQTEIKDDRTGYDWIIMDEIENNPQDW